MSTNLTYLITGANRGIGKGLTSSLLLRPHTTVIAGVRDIAKATPVLTSLPKADTAKLILIKLDSTSETDPAAAVSTLTTQHSLTHLDVLIANAGIAHSGGPVSQTTATTLHEHFTINSIAPLLLFQAFSPLLRASPTQTPKFLAVSTLIGSIASQHQLPPRVAPYGASKAALNWLVHRIHLEEEWLTAYVSHPGLVVTDMGREFAGGEEGVRAMGGIGVEESVAGLLETLDRATREEQGGRFMNVDGGVLPW